MYGRVYSQFSKKIEYKNLYNKSVPHPERTHLNAFNLPIQPLKWPPASPPPPLPRPLSLRRRPCGGWTPPSFQAAPSASPLSPRSPLPARRTTATAAQSALAIRWCGRRSSRRNTRRPTICTTVGMKWPRRSPRPCPNRTALSFRSSLRSARSPVSSPGAPPSPSRGRRASTSPRNWLRSTAASG